MRAITQLNITIQQGIGLMQLLTGFSLVRIFMIFNKMA